MGYYLADDIYPQWATLVKTIPMPQGDKRKLFAQHQEAARKDVGVHLECFNLDSQLYVAWCVIAPNNDVSTNDTHNGPHPNLAPYLQIRAQIQDMRAHLQHDLVEHIWQRFGHDDQQN
ncbi:unnamed protein product [Trifolium pratense]|uniref:Uncharacterized protein n=1 Tax=Trifolium pratense TaxID=57577 RepID=A0ACB0IZ18_TRIPR|nr:unnamed protein product [Trifolium pratense]